MTSPDATPEGHEAERHRPWPQLGDLALDIARNNRIGVVVGIPGEEGSEWLTYHLQAPGGGMEWSALADASTLRRLPSQISHATTNGQMAYDREARHWTIEIRFHHDDGGSQDGFLILTEEQMAELVDRIRSQESAR
ncbi:hypothetical protein [Streptosporangium carneum]|uniref:Uncharacterized protein n=1 Tax=Streptosporangium carneum TaxID=47481 RepID=A0A9W6ICT4_9ACTN|nr:hypothetical protein [Streptosporangium carneum]GLK15338.1 hypothetical protein GCM10017600_87510 [Streptosporangium carneum]